MADKPTDAQPNDLLLALKEERMARAQRIARVGSWEVDLATHRIWASTEAFRIYGLELTPDHEMPLEFAQSVPLPQYRATLDQALVELVSGGKPYDVEFEIRRHNDGAIRHIHSRAELVCDAMGRPQFVSGTLHDNTETVERDRALLQALRASEERARLTFEQAADAIILGDSQGKFMATNEQATKLTGYTLEELLDADIQILFSESTITQAPLRYDLIDKGELVISERLLRRKDGREVPIEMHTRKLSNGTLQSIMRDLTERRRLEEQLQLRQRMDSIGTLTSGIAHDFNNILAAIMGYGTLLQEESSQLEPKVVECVANILSATRRAADLIKSLRALSHPTDTGAESFDLHSVAAEAVQFLRATTDRVIDKILRVPAASLFVYGNASNLYHAFVNVCVNAVQAIEHKGATNSDYVAIDAELCLLASDNRFKLLPGSYVHVTISDTGIGMTEEVRQRAFEPLFSTKERGERKGQGLGLTMVYNTIVQQHHGAIDIESSPEAGCRIHWYLPRAQPAAEPAKSPPSPTVRGNERVLVVEDEPQLARLIETVLTRIGYQVIMATDGLQALEQFREHHRELSLVLLDRTLPGVRGELVFKDMVALRPDVPILVSSGDASISLDDFPGAAGILHKPYPVTLLGAAVREAIDKAR